MDCILFFCYLPRRIMDDRKLNPNTFASGLDDYPRSILVSDQERHVDLASWMAQAAKVMARLQQFSETIELRDNSGGKLYLIS